MPTYTFKNKKTGETWTEMMSISDSEKYLQDNPDVEKDITGSFPGFVSGTGIKLDSGFRDLLKKIDKEYKPKGGKINTF